MTQPAHLPASPDDVTPAWLTAVLTDAGLLRQATVAAVDRRIIGAEHGFTGVTARLTPRYAGLARAEPAPVSLIAKFPTAEQRDPAAARRHVERSAREVWFYRDIAPRRAVPVARMYFGAADEATERVVLLLQDFPEARQGDVLDGCSIDEAAFVLEAMARFHARWWGQIETAPFPWLPRWGGDHIARQERLVRQIGPFLERFGNQISPAVHELIERLRTCYADVLAVLDRAPATIIHADLHLDNILFNPPGSDPLAVILDWQSVSWGAAALDVATFLAGSLAVAVRRQSGDDLLRRYHATLTGHGVSGYPLDALRDDCRRALARQLAGTVGWLAGADLAHLPRRERAVTEAALSDGRLVSALIDFDVAAVLAR